METSTTDGLRYSSAPARRERILELVREASFVSASELGGMLGVSDMTIRRDIRMLADHGLVRAVHGGASRVPDPTGGTDFHLRSMQQRDEKRRIAAAALRFVQPDTTIALDAGTTALELARLLTGPMRLAVVTSSLPAMVILGDRPGIEVVGLGGILHPESQAFAGPATLAALRHLRVNQLFLAASAIGRGALWCGNAWDAETKRGLITIADEVIVLADATKFGVTAMTRVALLSSAQMLIVDDGITDDQRREVEAEGVRVVIAGPSGGVADGVDGAPVGGT